MNIRRGAPRRSQWKKIVKTNIQKFAGRKLCGLLRNAVLVSLGLPCLLLGLMVNVASAQPANDNFTNATVISGASGTTNGSNVGASMETPCEPVSVNTDDYGPDPVASSVWYAWTSPGTGTAQFNTKSSDFDTVLAVYTTTNGLCDPSRTLIGADDDSGGNTASLLNFHVTKGVTYYVCVDSYDDGTPGDGQGSLVLNWSVQVPTVQSGNFQLTTNLYTVSERDGSARITVTRTGAAKGRVLVDYAVSALTYNNIFRTNYYGTNNFATYMNTNGIFVTNVTFTTAYASNSYEYYAGGYQYYSITNASTNTVVAITNNGAPVFTPPVGGPEIPPPTNAPPFNFTPNTIYFQPPFTNAVIDTDNLTYTNIFITNAFELPSVSVTRVVTSASDFTPVAGTLAFDDYQMSQDITVPVVAAAGPDVPALTGIPSIAAITLTNARLDASESPDLISPTIDPVFGTGQISAMSTTFPPGPSLFNFSASIYKVSELPPDTINISVTRSQGSGVAATVDYRIDFGPRGADTLNTFPLQAGSDYATPNTDYTSVSGTLSWAMGDFSTKTFAIPITNDSLVEFNEDMQVQLNNPQTPRTDSDPGNYLGAVSNATVTILFDDQPAGAADRTWNVDNSNGSNPPYIPHPGTAGNAGTVYAEVQQPDGKIIVAGSFNSFDQNPYNRIVRLLNNGYQDPTFLAAPNSGANDFISALALQPDGRIIIAGSFTSFNGVNRHHIARLNGDGTLDTTFNPGLGADGMVWSVALQTNGQMVIGGEFDSVNGTLLNAVARLNADGSVDTSFNPGIGPDGTVNAVAVDAIGRVIIGGDFETVSGVAGEGVARLNVDGSLDTTFNVGVGTHNPGTGSTDPVYAIAVQPDGQILIGGGFSYFDLDSYNGIARLNTDGTVDQSFSPGTGTYNPLTGFSDVIYNITLQADGNILIGGDFTTYNQTRRVGIARLFPDGTLDTSFMDTAYNQFAGLINHYHNPDAVNANLYPVTNNRNFVYAITVDNITNVVTTQTVVTNNDVVSTNYFTTTNLMEGNVTIGGSFSYLGGGGTRDATLPRSNVAQLIGGSTPGPGNMEFYYNSYTADKDISGNGLFVSLTRTNGNLGIISATFSTNTAAPGPGIANANNFTLNPAYALPTWTTAWPGINDPTSVNWMYDYGVYGPNFGTIPVITATADVYVNIINDTNITGNLNANMALSNPSSPDFFLGGEVIPLGAALGTRTTAPLTIIDDNSKPGVLGFSSPNYYVIDNNGTATITITRIGGSDGVVQVSYATSNGSATNGLDYTGETNTLTFAQGVTTQTFTIPVIAQSSSSAVPDKTVNLRLYNATGGATLGLANAVLTINNHNFSNGHISFTSATFGTNENAGNALVSVARLGGSSGTITVSVTTADGTAINGVNYTAPNSATLSWSNLDVSVKTITIPVKDDGVVTSNLTVNLWLTNALLNTKFNANILGLSLHTNATLYITNVDSPGTVQFTSPAYSVKKYGGFALIPVVRTGGISGTSTVHFFTADGTALAGVNYYATNGLLTFTNGETGKYFRVQIIDDGTNDGLKTFTVTLTNGTPANALGVITNATINIIDTEPGGNFQSVNEPPGSPDVTYLTLGLNNTVSAMALQPNNQLIVGGNFTFADGVPRQRIARLNSDGTLDAKFSLPSSAYGANGSVRALAVQTNGLILVGGFFTNFNSVVMNYFARLNPDGSLDSLFNPGSGADNPVYAIAQTFVGGQSKILIGGNFATVGGTPINGIARLNDDGSVDTTFNPGLGANATVYALAVQPDGKVVLGGDFTAVNGTNFNHIARLNVDGSIDAGFNPGLGANDSVRAITLQLNGEILIGGLFTSVNGTAFNHIARLNSNGSVDSSFNPGLGANDAVLSIAVQTDSRIVLGGEFTQCSGVTRNGITRLNPDGTVDPTINFGTGANNFVAAIAIEEDTVLGYPTNVPDEKIIIGGSFTQYNGESHPYLARLYGGSIGGSGAFQFTSANYQAEENSSNAVITIIRTGGTSGSNSDGSGDIFVPVYTSDSTAKAGINYIAVTNNLDFPEGEVIKTIPIPLIDDMVITPNLTVNLAVNPAPPAEFGDQPTAVLTIINDDSEVNFSSTTYSAPKNAVNGAATINITRLGSTQGTAMVNFSTTMNGTAIAGTDYYPTNETVIFNPGVSNVTVTVPIINNGLIEGNQTVTMSLSNSVNTLLYSPSNAVLTIIDTVNAPGQLSFATNSYVVSEGGTNAYLTVVRTDGSSGSVSVNYTTVSGTGLPGTNYVTTSGTVNFADEITSQTFSIPLIDNSLVQGTVNFSVQLFNPSGGATLVTPTNANVAILDNDVGVSFVNATNYVSETNSTVLVFVQRTGNVTSVFDVNYTTTNGTAKAGVNYQTTAGILSFASGESLKAVSVPLINTHDVTNVTFSMSLSTTNSQVQLEAPSSAVVVIQPANAGLSFTNQAISVSKNGGAAVITVVCSNPGLETTNNNLSVNYFTSDGTGTNGIDYLATSGTLFFTNGLATNTFTVPIINNSQATGNRTFTVSLTNATAPGKITSPSNQVVTIIDSNSGLGFSASAYSILKTGVAAPITVLRTDNLNTNSAVNFTTLDGTAIAGMDYVATNGTLVFTNGQTSKTFTVTVIANTAVQPDKTVLLQLSNPMNGVLVPPSAATLTILDTNSLVVPDGSALIYESGPTNGIIDPGENVTLMFAFRAENSSVANFSATLLATNGVTSPSSVGTMNPTHLIAGGRPALQAWNFTASGTNGQQIVATFQLYDGASGIRTASFTYTLGTLTTTYYNTNAIIINDNTTASPYPSTINISGLGGVIVKAIVTLTNMNHGSASDIGVLLAAPDQQNTLLMSHAGGPNAISKVTLTFDDASTNSLPAYREPRRSRRAPINPRLMELRLIFPDRYEYD